MEAPFSRRVGVRDIEDIKDAGLGGGLFTKPLSRDERKKRRHPDIRGGGYSSAQTDTDMGKFILMFLGPVVAIFLIAGYFGWRNSEPSAGLPDPITVSCGDGAYEATFHRSEFRAESSTVRVSVTFEPGGFASSEDYVLPADPDAVVAFEATTEPVGNVLTRCSVRFIEG